MWRIAARCLRPDGGVNDLYRGQSRAQYFKLVAIAPKPAGAGRFGNAGVGIKQGPGTSVDRLGLAKMFYALTEGACAVELRLRMC